jgi:insertion element IS1 protein InsB
MAQRFEFRYDIDIACSDHYDVYDKYRVAKRHYITKAETSLVESFNSLIKTLLS